jgi:hypothetical protein
VKKLVGNTIERLPTDKDIAATMRRRITGSGSASEAKKRGVRPSIKRVTRRRSAIEPVIGHLKAEHRMRRNYLWFEHGDAVDAVLAAVGCNFRRLIRWLSLLLRQILADLCAQSSWSSRLEIGNLHGRLRRYPNEMNHEIVLAMKCSACNYASFARRKCDEQMPSHRLKARDFKIPEGDIKHLELPMEAASKNVYRPTITIKGGICKQLVIQGESCRCRQLPTVIGLQDILGLRVS